MLDQHSPFSLLILNNGINPRPGNVLLSFKKTHQLSNISVIDCEFVAIGPAFLDVANFVAELFTIGYFNSIDLTYAEILDSFVLAYVAGGGLLDVKRTSAAVGAAVLVFMNAIPRLMSPKSGRRTQVTPRKCVDHALSLIESDMAGLVSGEQDPFSYLSEILRDLHSAIT
jgi:hypothetical protein